MPPASRSTSARCTTCTAAGSSTSVTRARPSDSALTKMLPAGQRVRSAVEKERDTFARFDAADDGEPAGVFHGGEQLEVLAEAKVIVRCTGGERHAVEVEHAPHA